MTMAREMLDSYPGNAGTVDLDLLAAAIDACVECAQTCTACADACLGEDNVADMAKCIRSDLDCADICATMGSVLSRHTGYDANLTASLLAACITACSTCADECEQHADMHEHCRLCGEACRKCEQACRALMESIAA